MPRLRNSPHRIRFDVDSPRFAEAQRAFLDEDPARVQAAKAVLGDLVEEGGKNTCPFHRKDAVPLDPERVREVLDFHGGNAHAAARDLGCDFRRVRRIARGTGS